MVPAIPRGMRLYLSDADISSPGLWAQQGTDKQDCCCLPFLLSYLPILDTWPPWHRCIFAARESLPFQYQRQDISDTPVSAKGLLLVQVKIQCFCWCFVVIQRGKCKEWPVPPKAQPQMMSHLTLALLSLDVTDKLPSSWTGPRQSTPESPISLSYPHSHFSFAFTFPQEKLNIFLCSPVSASHLCGNPKTSLTPAPTACPSNKLLQQGRVFPSHPCFQSKQV